MRIFKYISGGLENILENDLIKVTPPNEFDDPFEFCPILEELSDADAVRYGLSFLNQLARRWGSKIDSELKKNGLPSLMSIQNNPAVYYHEAAKFQKIAKDWISKHQNWVSQEFGVVCFTENENDLLMWSMYADKHKGAMIEFDAAEIEKAWGTSLIKVVYDIKRPSFRFAMRVEDHAGFALKTVRTKSRIWQSQNEIRALCPLRVCERRETLYLRKLPENAITRVVLGMRYQNSNSIAPLLRRRANPPKLQQARIHEQEFTLDLNNVTF